MAKAMGKAPAKKSMSTTKEALDEKYLCYCCGNKKARSSFYVSTDPFNSVGVIPYS